MNWLEFQARHRHPGGFELDLAFSAERPVVALFGPSGSGKTTVLSLIAGFLNPDQGCIRTGEAGRVLVETSRGVAVPPEARGIGFVFQNHLLFPHLDVRANLEYGRRWRPPARHITWQRVIDVLNLGPLLDRFPRNLSGGESQRVALGRALLSGPEFLLMDEPLAALDEPLKRSILGYLEQVVREWNLPTLFVSHSQADVRRLADWVVVIREGRLIGAGTPEEALGTAEPLSWSNSAGPTNLLRMTRVEQVDRQWRGWVGEQRMTLPEFDGSPSAPVYVQVSPGDIVVCVRDVEGVSARNHLRGTIRQRISTGPAVFLAIDVGQMLWAEVTAAAADELQLDPGREVLCLIKTHSLRVVG